MNANNVDISNINTYWVSVNGKDSNPGTQEKPFRTIQKAADMATAGDNVKNKVRFI